VDEALLVGDAGNITGREIVLGKARILVGRDKASCDVVLSQPFISKCHAAFDTDESSRTTVRDLGSKFGTFVNGRPVVEQLLSDGDRIGFGPAGMIGFKYSAKGTAGAVTESGGPTPQSSRLSVQADADSDDRSPERLGFNGSKTLHFGTRSVLNIGRAPDNEIILNAAGISRHHARVTLREGARPALVDVGSTNGTYVNGDFLREPRFIEPDDIVFLGGFLFKIDGRTMRQIDLSASRICALGLSKKIKGQFVINDISLAVLPGEFVGLMGPSGCGKTTFMDALDGLQPAPIGSVFLSDLDLYRNFNAVRRSIGHVPQHDILHDDLTVQSTLSYAARLRLPETTTRRQIASAVAETVEIVNLQHKLATAFRYLSGGEQKRLSIAIELITNPTFLFLDEPTSPLDPETTEDLMGRFRKLANQGRTVVMITHKFEKFKSMDQVAFLAKGGRLAFFGPPKAALEYFKCMEPADIFRRMQQAQPDELNRTFMASSQYRTFVKDRVLETSALIHETQRSGTAAKGRRPNSSPRAQLAQWWTLTQRFFEIKLRDRWNTALLLVQAPVIATILVLISGNSRNDAKTLFIAAVIAVWFGANNAIREIVAEFPIYKRERRFSLRIPPYVFSKFAVLSVIGLVQTLMFLAILAGFHLLEWRDFPLLWLVLYLTTLGGISTALFFSAIVSSAEKALSILPLLLIPQLLLSGFLKPIDTFYYHQLNGRPASVSDYDQFQAAKTRPIQAQLGGSGLSPQPASLDPIARVDGLGAAQVVSAVVLARWSIDGLVHAVSLNNRKSRDRLAAQIYVASYETVFDGQDASAVADAYRQRIWSDLATLIAFSLLFLTATMWALKNRDVL
jgi:ABC-type multidrug transport system ATPase subunit/pSer/pThr/pTyr-binding forkhead associated (FHA) protein